MVDGGEDCFCEIGRERVGRRWGGLDVAFIGGFKGGSGTLLLLYYCRVYVDGSCLTVPPHFP